nr:reverse transcriptase domain-containing protein [Tanacetum cinerariifolium]
METKDTLSSCSNSEAQQMQQIQDKAKKSCMVSFRHLHSHLKRLSQNDLQGIRTESGFKRAFATLSCQDTETFIGTMFLNVEQLEKQLDKEDFQEIGSMAAFKAIPEFCDTLIQHLESGKKSIDERVQLKTEYDSWVNERQMQTTEEKVDMSQALDASSVDTESSRTESKEQDTSSRSGNDEHDDVADIRPIYDEEPMVENNFPLPVKKVATARRKVKPLPGRLHCYQKSRRNCQSKSNDSFTILVPHVMPLGESRASWSDKLDDALWEFCTAYKTPNGCTPYKIVYGKACHLPVELEYKAYWALKHANFDPKIAGDHRKVQINELNELRNQAYKNSLIYKEKTKRLHDSKIKNRVFNIG